MNLGNLTSDFHFLRPLCWWALVPLLVLWWLQRNRLQSGSWRAVVDAKLLSHLLVGVDRQHKRKSAWMLFGGVLAIAAFAGPAWRKIETPVFTKQSALVLVLDLSRSMDASDIKPSRLQRAHLKLRDILRARTEGDTALVVFAGQAFVVSPLTSDAKTIESQLSSLTTDLMPEQGSRLDRALELAEKLLLQANASSGQVLLLTDGLNDAADSSLVTNVVQRLAAANYWVSIMGVGTEQGAPIPMTQGGFVKDSHGSMVLPKLNDAQLNALAQAAGGPYRRLANDDSDWQALLSATPSLTSSALNDQSLRKEDRLSDEWHDEGVWLLLPLLLLATWAFRRGVVFMWMVAVGMLYQPNAAQADEMPPATSTWDSLWWRDDQRAQRALENNQPQQAAQLFRDKAWRGAAQYKAGDYQSALKDLEGLSGSLAEYNRGNALAQLGQYEAAQKAYENVLNAEPGNEDAKFNKELMKKLLESAKKQNQSGKGADQQRDQQNSQQQQQDQSQGQQSPESKDEQSAQNANQSASQQSSSSQASSSQTPSGQAPSGQGEQSASQSREGAGSNAQKQASGSSASSSAASSKNSSTQQSSSAKQAQAAQSASSNDKQRSDKTAQALADDQQPLSKEAEQWLRRVPDDPGGLWRRKFLHQYKQQGQQQQQQRRDGEQAW